MTSSLKGLLAAASAAGVGWLVVTDQVPAAALAATCALVGYAAHQFGKPLTADA